jgi:hypothetical protein
VQLPVGERCRGIGSTVIVFVQLERGKQPAPTGRPAHRAVAAMAHLAFDLPQFERCGRLERFQRDLHPARIFVPGRAGAKTKQRQRASLLKHLGRIGHAV